MRGDDETHDLRNRRASAALPLSRRQILGTAATGLAVAALPGSPVLADGADGTVDVLAKSSGGTYSLAYEICETGNPGNCARATLTLDLSGKN